MASVLSRGGSHVRSAVAFAVAVLIAGLVVALPTASAVPLPGLATPIGQQIFDGPNSAVYDSSVAPDGTTYLGGDFSSWGPQTGGGAAVSSTDASVNRNFPAVTGAVLVSVPDGAGGFYIGGQFVSVGGQPRQNLAHILATGQVDPNFTVAANGAVTALAMGGTTLYVGGNFTELGGQPRNWVGAVEGEGLLAAWNPGVTGTPPSGPEDTRINALTVVDDSVYIGGEFSQVSGQPRSNLASVGTDGNLTTWDPQANSTVYALAASGDRLYVGGAFTNIGTDPATYLAAFLLDTGEFVDGWQPEPNLPVTAIGLGNIGGPGGEVVYISGPFTFVNQQARDNFAAVNTAGGLLPWNPSGDGAAYRLTVRGDTIYAAGAFTTVGGQPRSGFAAIDSNGSVSTWAPTVNGAAWGLAVSGPNIYVGGLFNQVNGVARQGLAAVDSAGNLTSWNPGTGGADPAVWAVEYYDNKIYVGGYFTEIGGQPFSYAAAVDTNGAVSPTWIPEPDAAVRAITVDSSVTPASVYIGGDFTEVGGNARGNGAALRADDDFGTALLGFNPEITGGGVNVMTIHDGVIYIGGGMTSAQSQSRGNLAAFQTATGLVTSWNPVTPVNEYVNGIVVIDDQIYIAGTFNEVNGQSRSKAAAIGLDATLLSWAPELDDNVFAMASVGNNLLLGGTFTSVNSESRVGIAAVSGGDIATLQDWNPGLSWHPLLVVPLDVKSITVAGSNVYVGGFFSNVSNLALNDAAYSLGFARLSGLGLPGAPTDVGATGGDASATVRWTNPVDTGDSAITDYVIETAIGPAYNDWQPATTSGSPSCSPTPPESCEQLITGLTNASNYRVRVAAVNGSGTGGWSVVSQWFPVNAPSDLPGVPTGLTGVTGPRSITWSWTAPADPGAGAQLNMYRAIAFDGATPVAHCNTARVINPPTTCTTSNLTPGIAYTGLVRAFNTNNKFGPISDRVGPYTP